MTRSRLWSSVDGLRKARKAVEERAGRRCEAALLRDTGCNGYGSMAHHIIPRGRGGNHAPDNLMWVSAQCHDFIHNHPEEATALGYLKSAPPVDMMRLWGE